MIHTKLVYFGKHVSQHHTEDYRSLKTRLAFLSRAVSILMSFLLAPRRRCHLPARMSVAAMKTGEVEVVLCWMRDLMPNVISVDEVVDEEGDQSTAAIKCYSSTNPENF
ncbi:hypothetical protein NPIL_677751 [Nephila pilipes]|uniref:Uncharacterized protein n=1 Tax=Nephila pilipes TaxID=299642 RepID=A0A8X6PFY3_NEPPI|nr:hypothetical protein NPIL_677751 [Nephila pilipes]